MNNPANGPQNERPDNQQPNNTSPADFGRQIGVFVHDAVKQGMDYAAVHTKNVGAKLHQQQSNVGLHRQQPGQYPQQPKKPLQPQPPYRYDDRTTYTGPPARKAGGLVPWYDENGKMMAKRPTNTTGVVQIVFGGLGMGLGAFLTVPFLALGELAVVLALGLPVLGAGVALCAAGIARHDFKKRLMAYQSLLLQKNVMTFAELAAGSGFKAEQIKKDIKKGLRKGLLRYVWMDKNETCVMMGENTFHLYQQAEASRIEREKQEADWNARLAKDPDFAQMEAFRAEGQSTLKNIRAANDNIPGEEISAKLDVLEDTCSKIFTYVEAHPEKLPDTRKFLNYYLPTTLKIVDKYRQYETIEAVTPSITKARQEIENALDTINTAFFNLLNELYQDDTLDVSTDIEVLQTMLEQEGLIGNQFTIEAEPSPNDSATL